jgi:hypothetical protein
MAFNIDCFRRCLKSSLKWYVWVAFGAVAILAFILAFFTWGLSLGAAIAWLAGTYGAEIALALLVCYLRCG